MIEQSKNSCFSTIHLMIIKELRLERGVHQGVLAQAAKNTKRMDKDRERAVCL